MAMFVDWYGRDREGFAKLVNDPVALAAVGFQVFKIREDGVRDIDTRTQDKAEIEASFAAHDWSVIGIATEDKKGIWTYTFDPSIRLVELACQLDDMSADGTALRPPSWAPLTITVPGRPQAWQRAGRSANGGHFTQARTAKAERSIAWHAIQQVGQRSMQGALAVSLWVGMGVPRSWPAGRKAEALAGRLRPATKPDADNLAKTVLDALNGVLWADDSQVVDLVVSKHFIDQPRTIITVRQA